MTKTLTLAIAKTLIGKTICYQASGWDSKYSGIITIGGIMSEWDYYKTQPLEGYASRTAEWETWMNVKQIQEKKGKLILLDEEGCDSHHIYCHVGSGIFDEDTFTLSDVDREVIFSVDGN